MLRFSREESSRDKRVCLTFVTVCQKETPRSVENPVGGGESSGLTQKCSFPDPLTIRNVWQHLFSSNDKFQQPDSLIITAIICHLTCQIAGFPILFHTSIWERANIKRLIRGDLFEIKSFEVTGWYYIHRGPVVVLNALLNQSATAQGFLLVCRVILNIQHHSVPGRDSMRSLTKLLQTSRE